VDALSSSEAPFASAARDAHAAIQCRAAIAAILKGLAKE